MKLEQAIAAVQYALQMEKQGVKFYSEKAEVATNPAAKDLFTGLANMEEQHVEYLSRILRHLEEEDRFVDDNPPGDDIFGKAEREFSELDFGEIAALRMAQLLEHDFAEFYRKASESTDDPIGKRIYENLSQWELGHEKAIKDLLDELMQEYWYDMGFSPLY